MPRKRIRRRSRRRTSKRSRRRSRRRSKRRTRSKRRRSKSKSSRRRKRSRKRSNLIKIPGIRQPQKYTNVLFTALFIWLALITVILPSLNRWTEKRAEKLMMRVLNSVRKPEWDNALKEKIDVAILNSVKRLTEPSNASSTSAIDKVVSEAVRVATSINTQNRFTNMAKNVADDRELFCKFYVKLYAALGNRVLVEKSMAVNEMKLNMKHPREMGPVCRAEWEKEEKLQGVYAQQNDPEVVIFSGDKSEPPKPKKQPSSSPSVPPSSASNAKPPPKPPKKQPSSSSVPSSSASNAKPASPDSLWSVFGY